MRLWVEPVPPSLTGLWLSLCGCVVVLCGEQLDDVHLVGEICHCLKVLGASPDDPLLHTGRDFILQHQVATHTQTTQAGTRKG